MPKARVWLSYDLGAGGDYEGLYELLDYYGAKECGDSLAVFDYEYSNDPIKELSKNIEDKVQLRKEDRIYAIVVYRMDDSIKVIARFLYGKRRRPPWEGYAKAVIEDTIEDSP